MNREILALLLDYHRRTAGVWALLLFVQLMQTSTIWLIGSSHVAIVGAVIAALAFSATWDSPHLVMRTLPMPTRQLALLRWWERIGAPMLFIVLGLVLAWLANDGSRFPKQHLAALGLPTAASFATLSILSVLPLPMLSATRSNMPIFLIVWIAMVMGGLYGVPREWLPEPLPEVLILCGSLVALVSFGLARSGRVLQVPPLARMFASSPARRREAAAASRMHFHGWPVLVLQWMRTIVLLAFASVVVISIVRPQVRLLQQALPWVYVSVTGAIGTVLGRRWLRSLPVLRCLPIRSGTLAFVVCLALMAPVVAASLAATVINALVPQWGIAVPLYMLPIFALVPALEISWNGVPANHAVPSSVQQWSPIAQIVAWPLWTGSFMSLELTRLMPAWFDIVTVTAAVVLAVVAYVVVLRRLRSGFGLERIGDPLTPR